MSRTKVQLVSDIVGNVSGGASFTGIVTAAGGFNLGISSAGTTITSGPVKTLNFVGTGNTFAVSGTSVDISISGGSGGGGIGTVIKYADNTNSPFSFIDSEITITSNLDFNTTNAGGSNSYVVSVIPNVTVASGVAVTVGTGKTMVIDVLQIGDL